MSVDHPDPEALRPRDIEGFVEAIWEPMCSGGTMDSIDFFDIAEQFGMTRIEPYDPENLAHTEVDGDFDEGDPVYFLRGKETP